MLLIAASDMTMLWTCEMTAHWTSEKTSRPRLETWRTMCEMYATMLLNCVLRCVSCGARLLRVHHLRLSIACWNMR